MPAKQTLWSAHDETPVREKHRPRRRESLFGKRFTMSEAANMASAVLSRRLPSGFRKPGRQA